MYEDMNYNNTEYTQPDQNQNKGNKNRTGRKIAKLAAAAVAFGLIAGVTMQGVQYGFSATGSSRTMRAREQVPALSSVRKTGTCWLSQITTSSPMHSRYPSDSQTVPAHPVRSREQTMTRTWQLSR